MLAWDKQLLFPLCCSVSNISLSSHQQHLLPATCVNLDPLRCHQRVKGMRDNMLRPAGSIAVVLGRGRGRASSLEPQGQGLGRGAGVTADVLLHPAPEGQAKNQSRACFLTPRLSGTVCWTGWDGVWFRYSCHLAPPSGQNFNLSNTLLAFSSEMIAYVSI